ncbi:hypothetical protein [Hyphomicrobium sp.]|uniref:hypothetical protein n=1 Tax=Hyphomicrobium sp. TaxID=82 RepID=UPI002FE337BA
MSAPFCFGQTGDAPERPVDAIILLAYCSGLSSAARVADSWLPGLGGLEEAAHRAA